MYKITLFAAAMVLAASAVLADEQTKNWPLTGYDTNAEVVKSAYRNQCAIWAGAANLQGDNRDTFIANCQKDMGQVWPLGLEAGGGGGEG